MASPLAADPYQAPVRRSVQAPSSIVMVRPHHFRSNPQTAADNAFQILAAVDSAASNDVARRAHCEVTTAADTLRHHGIRTHLFEDRGHDTPDSVFPNNWFSTHAGGHVAVYPMAMPNRRLERRNDVIDMLKRDYRVQDVIDYSGLEADGLALEGTGAMVLDHADRVAYVARSKRADPVALERFCTHFKFEPMAFDAVDAEGTPFYHTNVLMSIATDFALIGSDCIVDSHRRSEVIARLGDSGRTVIALSREQITHFAGNAIELQGSKGRVLALSERAARHLHADQIDTIERSCALLRLSVPTIEKAGGSVRCMIAGIHLPVRSYSGAFIDTNHSIQGD